MNQSFVFFGSGPVALESLLLLKKSFTIEAVITKTATQQEMASACDNIPVFAVNNNQDLEQLIKEQSFTSSVGVLIDFGVLVSDHVIASFPKGIVNSHFSLLPELRGADPISFAILEGKSETGVSLMLLVKAMDQGPVLAQANCPLTGTETTPELTEKLIHISYGLITENLGPYMTGDVTPTDQDQWQQKNSKTISYTRKLTKEDGLIDWSKTAVQLDREIRAFAQWPKSRTRFDTIEVVVTKAAIIQLSGTPGQLFIHNKQLAVYCKEQALVIETLIPAGKKQMDSKAFLAGYTQRLPL